MTRQWYGDGTRATLEAFLVALKLLPGAKLELGPIEPEDVAAFGFFARGSQQDLDAFEASLEDVTTRRGIRVAPVDVQDRRRNGK